MVIIMTFKIAADAAIEGLDIVAHPLTAVDWGPRHIGSNSTANNI